MPVSNELISAGRRYRIVDLPAFAGAQIDRLPYVHRILLENVLRNAVNGDSIGADAIIAWLDRGTSESEIAFSPVRVMMHDTTCVPALVDIAGLRAAVAEAGGDPTCLNPELPVDVSVDHSIAVDYFGSADAMARNMERELARNGERYRFMKWATNALAGVRVHPPGTGIMHTLNLERLASVVTTETRDGALWAVPDAMIGTDSHTPMVNGIGVLAWGVGGLEAESVLFGMPVMLRVPEVVGVRLTGALREGCLATDLALTVTNRLRHLDLTDRFVEFFGPGVARLSAGERAVTANMTPEFGANSGYFPIDARVIEYLAATGRSREQLALVEDYARRQNLWHDPKTEPRYTERLEIDLSEIEPSVAGPRRPQDRLAASQTARALVPIARARTRATSAPPDGAVAIAAITSCTNTSDLRLLVAAGLLARNARRLGLKPPSWVKTSLAPGSPTAARQLARAGLLDDLAALGFHIVGNGCTTCIGHAGPLTAEIDAAIATNGIRPVAVLSGNRNFPGRVHGQIEFGFLASPPLVVAFALAGHANLDILSEPIGTAPDGTPVKLDRLWPSSADIDHFTAAGSDPADYDFDYARAEASTSWATLEAPTGALFPWDPASTYIRRPPFASASDGTRLGHYRAHPLIVVGNDITTDHISPAGQIPADGKAGRHLVARGENPADLNVFASRRGNWEVMLRGVFTNKSVRNLLAENIPPGWTVHAGSGDVMPLYAVARRYQDEGAPVVIVAGERYGMGSSRDWAAKGVALLGLRAVLAAGFERIHRSNLIGMGVLPLRLPQGYSGESLALSIGDLIEIAARPETLAPRSTVAVTIHRANGGSEDFAATAAIETKLELEILNAGGILPLILQNALRYPACKGV